MFKEYAECEIEIQPRRGATFPFVVRSPGGNASGKLRLPTSDTEYQQLERQLAALDTNEARLTRLGQILFKALFQGQVKEVYAGSQGTLQDGQGLRIKLIIAADEREVAALPWELLNDPDRGPLALLDMPIVRYIPQPIRVPTLKTELPLKVLLTGAQTPPPAEVERELRAVQETLSSLGNHVQCVAEPHLTTALLRKRLREGFHVWHFVGHGGFSAEDQTGLLRFEDETGDVDEISATQLGIMLNRSGVRLIMLDACESGRIAIDPFRSLAPALIRAQVPAVLAMQFTVPEESTRAFATEFYRTLAEGFPIDACVTEGRKAVLDAAGLRNPDWGIPVVYTRAPDGKLFELPAGSAGATAASEQSGGTSVSIGSGNTLSQGSSITISNVGSTAVSGPGAQTDGRAEQAASLQNLIRENRRRLNQLQLQAAKYGISTPPHITIEIEDTEREIAKLEKQLKEL
jgi:hypothetical protein